MKPTLLILAAGLGSRYGSLKQLDRIGPSGETIIDFSIYDAIRAGFGKVVFVINKKTEPDFKEVFIDKLKDKIEITYVLQEIERIPEGIPITPDRKKPWGTGHAILMAAEAICEPFAMINADDFYGAEAFRAVADFYRDWAPSRPERFCMVAYRIENTLSEHGSVSRGVCRTGDAGLLSEVTERTQIGRVPGGIAYREEDRNILIPDSTVVSMNFWGFTPALFGYLKTGFDTFIRKNAQDAKAEYYIPSVVTEMIGNNSATVQVLTTESRWFGMTYRQDRETVMKGIVDLIHNGSYPARLWK